MSSDNTFRPPPRHQKSPHSISINSNCVQKFYIFWTWFRRTQWKQLRNRCVHGFLITGMSIVRFPASSINFNYFPPRYEQKRIKISVYLPFLHNKKMESSSEHVIGLIAMALHSSWASIVANAKLVSPSRRRQPPKNFLKYLFIALEEQQTEWQNFSMRRWHRCERWQPSRANYHKGPYYYTILSNKYVVNDDDDTHWTGWITQLLSTSEKGSPSVDEKKAGRGIVI